MKDGPTIAPDDAAVIEREAQQWLVLLTSGRATVGDVEALKRWCGQSRRHAHAFAEANQVWEALGPAASYGHVSEQQLVGAAGARAVGRRALLAGGGAALAAAIGYVVVRPPLDLWPSVYEYGADVRTGTGERRQLSMTGVSIELNTRTSLNVRRDQNQVEFVAGEAAIATTRKLDAPLTIVAGGGRLHVSDAQLNLRCDSERSVVTCQRGSVAVDYSGAVATLHDGQQIAYANGVLHPATTVDPAIVLAWRDGQLIFRQTPLSQVIEEINRYRSGRIVLMNEALGRRPVAARVALDRTDDLIVLVREAYGAHVTTLPGGIVLLS